jgi:GTP cyclohydrolase I
MSNIIEISWGDFQHEVTKLAKRIGDRYEYVYGVPTGGSFVAMELARISNLQMIDITTDMDNIAIADVLIVDDLVDSGKTLERYYEQGYECDVLYRKPHSPKDMVPQAQELDGWIKFPWEHETGPEDAIVRMLSYIGEDPNRVGLKDTPERVVRMWGEIYRGYDPNKKPKETCFPNGEDGLRYDEMIIDTGYFFSQCEHHMVPFFGQYWFAYIPGSTIIGLSKVADWIDYKAAKLQIQERLVKEVLDELTRITKDPVGIGLVMKGRHLCKEMRDVKKYNSAMITTDLRGVLREDHRARAEFMRFVG